MDPSTRFANDIEVSGEAIRAAVSGMGAFQSFALEILAEHGIAEPVAGAWYPRQAYLDAFRTIAERMGPKTLFTIGSQIPESARFPKTGPELEDMLRSIDVAYHMNHRRGGRVMYDPATETMLDGIGHYHCEVVRDGLVRMTCRTPYPCDFDRGIISAVVNGSKPPNSLYVSVVHAPGEPSRESGADHCVYLVEW